MSNKETLQAHNTRLGNNNISLAAILDIIKNLPDAEIPRSDYVQDGLVALFDGRDLISDNGRWTSRTNSDYWYVSNGSSTLNDLKTEDSIATNGAVSIRNNQNYYQTGYTIELVGMTPSTTNTNFLCFDKNQSTHININRFGEGVFSPQYHSDGAQYLEQTIDGLVGSRHTMVIYLKQIVPRNTSDGTVEILYSVDGSPWYTWGPVELTNATSAVSYYTTLLSYYSTNSSGRAPSGAEVCAVRVYDRQLTEEELVLNHAADKANYNF